MNYMYMKTLPFNTILLLHFMHISTYKMEKKFYLMKPNIKKDDIASKWSETLSRLDGVFNSEHQNEVIDIKFNMSRYSNDKFFNILYKFSSGECKCIILITNILLNYRPFSIDDLITHNPLRAAPSCRAIRAKRSYYVDER